MAFKKYRNDTKSVNTNFEHCGSYGREMSPVHYVLKQNKDRRTYLDNIVVPPGVESKKCEVLRPKVCKRLDNADTEIIVTLSVNMIITHLSHLPVSIPDRCFNRVDPSAFCCTRRAVFQHAAWTVICSTRDVSRMR